MTWEQAAAYAESLTLGGYSDWRLPFGKELFSLMDEGTINPALNTDYFPKSTAEYWWSSDTAVDNATKVWVTNAGGGIGPHPKTETISAGGTKRFHVRCVRDPAATGVTQSLRQPDRQRRRHGDRQPHGPGVAAGRVGDDDLGAGPGLCREPHAGRPQRLAVAQHQGTASRSATTTSAPRRWTRPTSPAPRPRGTGRPRRWCSDATQAWYLDSDYGLTSYDAKTGLWHVRCVRGGVPASLSAPGVCGDPARLVRDGRPFRLHRSGAIPPTRSRCTRSRSTPSTWAPTTSPTRSTATISIRRWPRA